MADKIRLHVFAISGDTETGTGGKAGTEKEGNGMLLDRIALALVIIGALNWGAIGLFGFDLVAFLCGGQMAVLSRVIYAVVGLAGLWCMSLLFRENAAEASA